MHVLAHPALPAAAGRIQAGQIAREGFVEVLGCEFYNSLAKAASPNQLATLHEGIAQIQPAPAPAVPGYGDASSSAQEICGLVPRDNLLAAFHLGHLNLIGL
jgi:hypothetical protein